MAVVAAILAAGQGTRFGSDKVLSPLGDKPLWRWSYDTFSSHPAIDRVMMVGSESNLSQLREAGESILGGRSRQESSFRATMACNADDILLVHDAARPFVSTDVIDRVLAAVIEHGAAAACQAVTDTIKLVEPRAVVTLDRSKLRAMQTPQGARCDLLRRGHEAADHEFTDEMAMLEAIGIVPALVAGSERNFKITSPEDLVRATIVGTMGENRTGIGYDIHPFSGDPSRTLWLGGVAFPEHPALDGHSDADVLLHAITDALLGAAGLGDIGAHFPNTDPRWAGEPSTTFLAAARDLLSASSWTIVNVDATVIAESPKIMPRVGEIRAVVAGALALSAERVSVKATTNEKLGSLGRGEGISAFAVATITRNL